jgi:Spy/CpxP family protein refolding chaperone
MNNTWTLKHTLAAAVLAISIPAVSFAFTGQNGDKGDRCEKGQFHGDKHGMRGGAPYLAGLDLTSAQDDQLFALNHALEPIMREQHKQHQQLIEEMHSLTQADKLDEAKLQLLADKAAKLEKDKALTIAHHEAKVFALLTPEQRKKAREFKMPERGMSHDGEHHNHEDGDHPVNFKNHRGDEQTRRM